MKKNLINIILIEICIVFQLLSQTPSEILDSANTCFTNKKYTECIELCERVKFLSDFNDTKCNNLLLQSYYLTEQYKKALLSIDDLLPATSNDSVVKELLLFKCHLNILTENPIYAVITLRNFNTGKSEYFSIKKYTYLSLALFLTNDYTQSQGTLMKLGNFYRDFDTIYVNKIYINAISNAHRSRKLPIYLSVIPGLGKICLGEYSEGFYTFILNGVFITGAIFTTLNIGSIDAFITFLPFMRRYYLGSFARTKQLADNKMNEINTICFNMIVDYCEWLDTNNPQVQMEHRCLP